MIPWVRGRVKHRTCLVRNLVAVVTMAQFVTFNTRTPKQPIVEIPDNEDAEAFISATSKLLFQEVGSPRLQADG